MRPLSLAVTRSKGRSVFVAWRDLRFARGRFAVITSVITLITLLVGFLSALMLGLANQNISALTQLGSAGPTSPGVDGIVFSQPATGNSVAFSDSEISAATGNRWSKSEGVDTVEPIGISRAKLTHGDLTDVVSTWGVQPSFGSGAPTASGEVALSQDVADALQAGVGDIVHLSHAELTVTAVTPEAWYSHSPVVWISLEDWTHGQVAQGNDDAYATVLAVSGSQDALDAAAEASGTVVESIPGSLMALDSFRSEISSLLLMLVMLLGISALVVGAFFTVWTIGRKPDIAVLKALGASTGTLVRDALGQALVVLVLGVGLGLALTVGLGALAGAALPFVLSPLSTLLPAGLLIVLGLIGAAVAVRSVTKADPLTALAAGR